MHAGAADLARLYPRQMLRPLLLAGDGAESITHAYAAMKLLALRRRLMSVDVLVAKAGTAAARRQAAAIAGRLASCAERFLGALGERLGGAGPGLRRARAVRPRVAAPARGAVRRRRR